MKLIESAGAVKFRKYVVKILFHMSKKKTIPCQNTTFRVALTVLGQTVNAMVDIECSNSIMPAAALAQMQMLLSWL